MTPDAPTRTDDTSLIRVPHGHIEEGADAPRHFVSWTCYRVAPEWRRLPEDTRVKDIEEFAEVLDNWSERMVLTTYTAVGLRPDMDFMTWRATPDLDLLQQCQTDIYSTHLGTHLETVYLYTATTRQSQYTKAAEEAGFKRRRPIAVTSADRRYFIVYPFVKQRRWYALDEKERSRMMREHAMIGREWPGVKLNTAFSFGIDDQEFMTAFETDSVHDFVDLMMALRSSDASQYTERDTPIFTCIRMPARAVLGSLGGMRSNAFA